MIFNTRGTLPGFLLPMSYLLSKTRPTGNRSPSTLVHLLDDDSLLIIFSFCRPVILDESKAYSYQLTEGGGMEPRAMVVQAYTSLSEVAVPRP